MLLHVEVCMQDDVGRSEVSGPGRCCRTLLGCTTRDRDQPRVGSVGRVQYPHVRQDLLRAPSPARRAGLRSLSRTNSLGTETSARALVQLRS